MPPSEPQNVFEATLPAIPNQKFRFTFHPVCPGPVVSSRSHCNWLLFCITLRDIIDDGNKSLSPGTHPVSSDHRTCLCGHHSDSPGDSSNPTYVSGDTLPIHPGDPSNPTYVSVAVSPIPIKITDLLPSDFPFTASELHESQDEPELFYKTPPLPTRTFASDRGPEKREEIRAAALVQVGSPEIEIISETELESD